MRTLPMFPLGTVLFPHALLPLHVFEPRYRQMLREVVDGDREFGVVLIVRGHEVGGGDQRADTGTVARLLQARELDDGRWVVAALGTRRLRVHRWLPDAPYPRAEVAELAEPPVEETTARVLVDTVLPRLQRVLALQSELGDVTAPTTLPLDDNPSVAVWQLATAAPLTAFDAQRLLETDGWADRLALLDRLLGELEEVLHFRLSPGA